MSQLTERSMVLQRAAQVDGLHVDLVDPELLAELRIEGVVRMVGVRVYATGVGMLHYAADLEQRQRSFLRRLRVRRSFDAITDAELDLLVVLTRRRKLRVLPEFKRAAEYAYSRRLVSRQINNKRHEYIMLTKLGRRALKKRRPQACP